MTQRIRRTMCSIKGCPNTVRRANAYSLCVNHLISVWEFVGTKMLPNASFYRDDEPFDGRPDPAHVVTEEEMEARRLARKAATLRAAKARGTLYALDTRNGLIKFGYTARDVYQRLSDYPPDYRLIVATPGTKADERDLHRSLKTSCAAGREWYNVTPEVVRQINQWIALENTRAMRRYADKKAEAEQARQQQGFTIPWMQPGEPPVMLPRFESVEQWFAAEIGRRDGPAQRMPAPKIRVAGRRI